MKKWWLLFTGLVVFYSCLDNDQEGPNYFLNKVADDPNYRYEYLPIDSAITPESFTFGETDTITMTYFLLNGCYSFDQIYKEVKGTTSTVAVSAIVELDLFCTEALIEEQTKFTVKATQKEDYVFKFYKGLDSTGSEIFEEVVVPVK